MGIKVYKPTTPGRKNKASVLDTSHLSDKKPEPSLTTVIKKSGGRNNEGKITVRHRGGENKRLYRQIDFERTNFGVEGEVTALEYDPNRSAHIALVEYPENEDGANKAYILAAESLEVGDKVKSSQQEIEADVGNRMPLKHIPIGLFVYNLEFTPGKGGQIVRSAGAGAQLQAREEDFIQVRLPSGEVRMFSEDCLATIGRVGNPEHELVKQGKAGRNRHRGKRPTVKGKAMNPVDHPHGGGAGWTPVGLETPKTPEAKKTMGKKTRNKNKESDKFIVKRRNE
ncbi:MAG: 50S ribosomal protein L2 [Candidatus Magasanikbacteria bacterium]